MGASRPGPVVVGRAVLPLLTALALLLAGAVLQPAAATQVAAVEVALGEHRFGKLRQPDAVVLKASPDQIGFEVPPPGADGVNLSPWSFDVARDGSIWLMDEINQRLLTWRSGQSSGPARSLPLPDDPLDRPADFAVTADGSIYVSYVPPPGGADKNMRLAALDPSGKVRWTSATANEIFNAKLRLGPDGTLYVVRAGDTANWMPLATPAGRPLPVAEQRRRTSTRQPLPGGRWLTASYGSSGRRDVTLGQGAGPLRAWKVTSKTELGALPATPALVGGDPVIVVGISRQTAAEFLYEFEVLRLGPKGETRQRFAIAPDSRVVFGDTPITGVRVGPDGNLYQMRSDRRTGLTIVRYDLGAGQSATPTTRPGSGATEATTPSVTQPTVDQGVAVPTTLAATDPLSPTADTDSGRSSRLLVPGLIALAAGLLAAAGAFLLHRRSTRSAR